MYGFGISEDDILAVALVRGLTLTDQQASDWFDEIDTARVEAAAMDADDLDEQTELAHAEIDRQLDELGYWAPVQAQADADELDEATPQADCRPSRRM